ncbi:MAG: DUF115 domain-containing protein [Holophagaceae bacterium]|nr:DUF115 domain-containing protein [Holophagaceae bacterium]
MLDFRKELAKIAPNARKGGPIYVFGTGRYWEQIRRNYKLITGINLEDFIEAFVDNDQQKQNTMFYGKKIVSPQELDPNHSVVLVSAFTKDLAIERQLHEMGYYYESSCFSPGQLDQILKGYLSGQILQFRDKHKGESCFVIGNGPSLRAEDLTKLKSEIAIASNKIYLIFDKTDWRPTYYQVTDFLTFANHKEIINKINCTKFILLDCALYYDDYSPDIDNTFYFSSNTCFLHRPYPYKTLFSSELDVLGHGNVTYCSLQVAVNMGFHNIYLLGVENNYPKSITHDGEIVLRNLDSHFCSDYDAGRPHISVSHPDYINATYEVARKYADAHGIKIYNATRGGKLEVFERIDFDTLF